MRKSLVKITEFLFFILLFTTPLVLFPETSELFEFNKMVLTYVFTVLITSVWVIRMVVEKKIIFRRTLLDIPLIIFLVSQLLSTFVSVDTRTSLLGFYSRFHGGLMSSIAYSLLYWAWVSNMNLETTIKGLRWLLTSAILVCVWAIFEHFGRSFSCLMFPGFQTFDVSCWIQDVQNRVFASLGQPNWLGAWITAIIPFTWAYGISNKLQITNYKSLNKLFWIGLSALFFLTLLYTKSRSGILAFSVAFLAFWGLSFFLLTFNKIHTTALKKLILFPFLAIFTTTIFITLAVGTPWTPKLSEIFNKSTSQQTNDLTSPPPGPALEVGGTESGEIRRIVWKGAIEIWKHYPILGSGVETFGFSYYNFRPAEHNLVSEWDYLYNKAHNEYLNFAATTGTVGLLAYLNLIIFSGFLIMKKSRTPKSQNAKQIKNQKSKISFYDFKLPGDLEFLRLGIFAGYASILITNFFGFSVVVVALQFFLYPAIAVSLYDGLETSKGHSNKVTKLTTSQVGIFGFVLLLTTYFLQLIFKYWYADYLYAQGRYQNDSGNYLVGRELVNRAIKFSPNEAIYWSELASSTTALSLTAAKQNEYDLAKQLATSAVLESLNAVSLSPANVNLKRDRANRLTDLSPLDQNYLLTAQDIWEEAAELAPTEARVLLGLSLSYLRTGNYEKSIEVMERTVELKPNYRNARFALALMYIDVDEKEKAKAELNYILENLNPNDSEARTQLEELTN